MRTLTCCGTTFKLLDWYMHGAEAYPETQQLYESIIDQFLAVQENSSIVLKTQVRVKITTEEYMVNSGMVLGTVGDTTEEIWSLSQTKAALEKQKQWVRVNRKYSAI